MDDSMNEKIKKLLRLAERAGTPAEAEVARGKAMRLMTKWGIDQAMLGNLGENSRQEQIVTRMTEPFPALFRKARMHMVVAIANGMGNMKCWISGGSQVAVMGWESDVDRLFAFYHSILLQADNDLVKWWKDYPLRGSLKQSEAMRARRNFLFGFSNIIQKRLTEMRVEEVEATAKPNSTALVLRDRGSMVDDKFNEEMAGRLRAGRSLKGSLHGGEAGRAAGARARLGGSEVGGGARGILGG